MSEQRLAQSVAASISDPQLIAVEEALRRGDLRGAEHLINTLIERPDDNIVALRFSGDLALRRGHMARAEAAYRACLERAPSYDAARHGLATVLFRQMRFGDAWREAEQLPSDALGDRAARTLKAALAASIGNHWESIALYRGLVAEHPDAAQLWVGLGHGHRIVGEFDAAISAYREAIARNPRFGEAYWSLANLKSFDFTENDIAAMTTLAGDASLPDSDRAAVEFALGQAFLARDEAQSFEHFRRGNATKRRSQTYDATAAAASLQRWTGFFTSERMRSIVSAGDPARDPIFVVGLPRSGSTLVEQILGSHPQIEATSELPYLDIVGRRASETGLEPDRDWAALGQDYLTLARANRCTSRPLFVDKRPNNFAHIGLIRLILPNAKIIDIRRHPLAACLSIYRQLFARGRPYAYDLAEIAHWYRAYVTAMDRFDAAFPGYVHHIRHEALVDDTEGEVRRLLDHVGVPFDPGCLRFHANGQPVRTPSSEQVRRPIFRDALTEWQRYREQLAPAAELLGDLIDAYPSAPNR